VDFDEIDQVLDAEVSEGHLAIFGRVIDPHHAVLDLHADGDFEQPGIDDWVWRRNQRYGTITKIENALIGLFLFGTGLRRRRRSLE
jgi:predicted acetyltransferase